MQMVLFGMCRVLCVCLGFCVSVFRVLCEVSRVLCWVCVGDVGDLCGVCVWVCVEACVGYANGFVWGVCRFLCRVCGGG